MLEKQCQTLTTPPHPVIIPHIPQPPRLTQPPHPQKNGTIAANVVARGYANHAEEAASLWQRMANVMFATVWAMGNARHAEVKKGGTFNDISKLCTTPRNTHESLKKITDMKSIILVLFTACVLFSACRQNDSTPIVSTLSSNTDEIKKSAEQNNNHPNNRDAHKSKEEYLEEIFGVSPTPSTYYTTPAYDMSDMAPEWHNCSSCMGSGECKYCYGTGYYEYSRSGRCEVCYGTGRCAGCDGDGGWYI